MKLLAFCLHCHKGHPDRGLRAFVVDIQLDRSGWYVKVWLHHHPGIQGLDGEK